MFSCYGIPLEAGQKSRLVGMLMIDRSSRCPENYIGDLRRTFGEAIIGPITLNGDRGLFTQMRIEGPYSLNLVTDNLYGPNMEETRYVLDLVLQGGWMRRLCHSIEIMQSGLDLRTGIG